MFRRFYKRQLLGLALGLGLVAAAPAFAAPPATPSVADLARIQYPGTSSLPTVYMAGSIPIPDYLTRIQYPGTRSQPTVYLGPAQGGRAPEKAVPYGQIAIPAWLARIQYPGTSSLPTVVVTPTTGASTDSSFDWASAGVGAGFVAGLGVVAVGVALALRRRRSLAHA
jgi:MYXO-CTERM domain-containing protein